MIRIIEQHTQSKSTTTPSEDAVVVISSFAAVIDGATPKSAFRYPSGETPGAMAARLLSEAITQLPPNANIHEASILLSKSLHQECALPCNRPTASCILYSDARREIWMLGDCQFATIQDDGHFCRTTNEKTIDRVLSDWRRSVNISYLSRGLLTQEQISVNDPGRSIIQPFITRQTRFQNLDSDHRFAFCMLDGEPIPERFLRVIQIAENVKQLILASDGYPELLPTLAESEARLQTLLQSDPLCIGPLLGTKGVRPGCQSFDDRTYLSIEI